MRRVVLGILVCAIVLTGRHVDARAPAITAWWSASNSGGVSAPAPPDVSSGELLIQGVAAGSASGEGQPLRSAVAGISFVLSPDEVVGGLSLEVASASPQASLRACRITAAFASTHNGSWNEVPSSDCEGAVEATVVDGALDFGDVGHLRADTHIALLLEPTVPGRVVISPPGDGALEVFSPEAAFAFDGSADEDRSVAVTQAPDSTPSFTAPAKTVTAPAPTAPQAAPPADAGGQAFGADRSPAFPETAAADRRSGDDLATRAATAVVVAVFLVPFALRGTGLRLRRT